MTKQPRRPLAEEVRCDTCGQAKPLATARVDRNDVVTCADCARGGVTAWDWERDLRGRR